MNFSQLRTLAEGATGYTGGSFRDEMPELSLTEAMARLPIVCLENQRELISLSDEQNTALVEAAVSAINTGNSFDATPIVEASLEGIKKKISEVFAKIKKFIRSIIDKLKLAIDKMKMSGHQLWSKYGDSAALKQDFSKAEFTITGYKFSKEGVLGNLSQYDSIQGIESLIKGAIKGGAVLPKEFNDEITKTNGSARTNYDDYKDSTKGEARTKSKIVENLKNSSTKEREKAIVSAITGIQLSGEDWQSALRKKIYGEKVEIKVGKDGFTVDAIRGILGGDNKLDQIKEEYTHLESTVGEYEDQLNKELDSIKTKISDNLSGTDNKTSENNALNIVSQYYTAYVSIVNQTISLISAVKNINWSYEKARYDQAKAMLGKMLSYKAPNNNSDASDVDEADLAMIDFDL
ncbi:MAG: hypothetical protein NC489_07985 [Ruminococcus flavefaciens]|nr:hypothetical protein [Ruminococcus flavefaciens]